MALLFTLSHRVLKHFAVNYLKTIIKTIRND